MGAAGAAAAVHPRQGYRWNDHGFTTIRDPAGGDAGLAQAIREGLTAAPRYLFCGAALSQTGGHGDPRPPELGCCLCGGHMAEVVDGVVEIGDITIRPAVQG